MGTSRGCNVSMTTEQRDASFDEFRYQSCGHLIYAYRRTVTGV